MQAYARAEPASAEQRHQAHPSRRRGERAVAKRCAAGMTERPEQSASLALAALLLDGLDEDGLRVLAKRLAPHISRLQNLNQQAPIAFTVDTLAADLGLSRKTIRCAITRGELRAVKRGSRWIISADAVAEWTTPSESPKARARGCAARVPKTAGPSLRSVLCGGGAR
jgi:excisionase family DNA binding protein